MQILFYVVIVLHVIVCFFLIGVVLLQQGRSADLAGAFGGQGSQTAFGPRAAANVLTRLTTWSAIIFMCTSISLVVLFVRSTGSHSVLEGTNPLRSALPPSPASKPGSSDRLENLSAEPKVISKSSRPIMSELRFARRQLTC